MPPCSLPMREELPPIGMKDECRRTSATKNKKDHRRCGSSKSAKSCVSPTDSTDPLSRLASLLKYRSCKDIIIMAGAGISTASGIPDFRSPGTGLYYNTGKYNVSSPTDVFDLKYFNKNPYPFMDIIRDFIKTEKDPNNTHGFCKLLETKGLLLRMYTQNIDGLEKKSGISPTRLVEAHGTMESASCVKCFTSHSTTWTEKMIMSGKVPSCKRKGCSGYVKPDIVMFGEELPKKFYLYPRDFEKCDLLLIMGTSLNVEPFSELVDSVPKSVPRVLFNRDAVGPFSDSRRKNDIFIRGDITTSINKLVKMLGWSKALNGVTDHSERERSSSRADSGSSDQTRIESRTSSNVTTPELTKVISIPTWACSRTSVAITQEMGRDSLSLPNSVVRNVSDQSLGKKVSSLSLSESISTITNASARRSFSAPLPKYTTSKTTVDNSTVYPSSCSSDEILSNSDVDNIVSTVLSTQSSKSTFIGKDMINVQDDESNKNPNTTEKTAVLTERRVGNEAKKYKQNTVVEQESPEKENFQKKKVLKSDEDAVWTPNGQSNPKQISQPLPLITEQPVIKETLYDTVQTVMSTYSNLSIQNINSNNSSFLSHSEQSSLEINTISRSRSKLSVANTPISLVRGKNLGKKVIILNGVSSKEQVPSHPKPQVPSHPKPQVPSTQRSTQINTQRSFSNLLKPDTSDVLKSELKTFITKKLKASSIRNEKQVKERKSRKYNDSPSRKKKLPFTVPVTASTIPKDKRGSPGKSRKSSTKTTKELHQILSKNGHIPSTLSLGVGKKFVNNGISSKSWTPNASTKNTATRRNIKQQIVLYSVGITSKPEFKWIKDKSHYYPLEG